jgi:hypothetical protein
MAKKTHSTTLSQLPREVIDRLSSEQQTQLTKLLNEGNEVAVVNGQLFIQKTLSDKAIVAWDAGQVVQGTLISVKESSSYKNNWLGTFKLNSGDTVVKPLNKVLYDKLLPYLDAKHCVFTITCKGLVKGDKYSYHAFDVIVAQPLF